MNGPIVEPIQTWQDFVRVVEKSPGGHEAWPEVKPVLRRALEMRRQIAREGWWN
jgi:hypothetical protein